MLYKCSSSMALRNDKDHHDAISSSKIQVSIGRESVHFRSHQRDEFGIAANARYKRVNGICNAYVGYLISTNVVFSQSTP